MRTVRARTRLVGGFHIQTSRCLPTIAKVHLSTGLLSIALLSFGNACGGAGGSHPNDPGSTGSDDATQSSNRTMKSADFSLDALDGTTVSLSDYAGKNVVLLDFWATWCEPCLAAMPHLNDIYRKYNSQGFVLLSISMDGPDTVAEVRSYARRHNLAFPILLDEESRAVSLFNPKRSAPFAVLIGRDGTVLNKRDGYRPGDEAAIEAEIVNALSR